MPVALSLNFLAIIGLPHRIVSFPNSKPGKIFNLGSTLIHNIVWLILCNIDIETIYYIDWIIIIYFREKMMYVCICMQIY